MNPRSLWRSVFVVAYCLSRSYCIAQQPPIVGNDRVNVFSQDVLAESVVPAEAEPSKYWIGLLCVDVGDALRAQLDLEAGVGLVVDAVTDDSPAKKSGVQQYDVLLSTRLAVESPDVVAKKLTKVSDLVESVQAAETKPIQIELLHRGQRKTIELVPAERPKSGNANIAEQKRLYLNTLDEAHRLWAFDSSSGNRIVLAGPVIANVSKPPALPEGLTMEFRQVVGEPEKILVTKGEQKWEITDLEVAKLPEEIRVHVLHQLAARRIGQSPQMIAVAQPVRTVTKNAAQSDPAPRTTRSLFEAKYTPYQYVAPVALAKLPEDVSVIVIRKGSEPMRVTVKRSEQTWEVTEKDLDKLPNELRSLVGPILGRWDASFSSKQITRFRAPKAGDGVVVATPADEPSQTAESIRRYADLLSKTLTENERRVAANLRERQALIETREKELGEQFQMMKQLKELNENIEKLRQSLDKSVPK